MRIVSTASRTNAAMSETDTMPTGLPSSTTGRRRIAELALQTHRLQQVHLGLERDELLVHHIADRYLVRVVARGDHGVSDLAVGE